MPELVGPGDLEEAGSPSAGLRADGLQQSMLAHQPLDALAVDRPPRLTRSRPGDHRRPVGWILIGNLEHPPIGLIERWLNVFRRPTRPRIVGLAAGALNA